MQRSESNMATLVRSQLNPLATTFIPSNMSYHKKVNLLKAGNEYGYTTSQQSEKQYLNDRDTHYKISKDIIDAKRMIYKNYSVMEKNYSLPESHLQCHLPVLKCSTDCKEQVRKLNVDRKLSCPENSYLLKTECSTDCKVSTQKSNDRKCRIQNSYLRELGCSTDDQKLVQKSLYKVLRKQSSHPPSWKRPVDNCKVLEKESNSGMVTPKGKECTCPRMFGWIVPPDFLGNPFNLKYECGKKYPHSSDTNMLTLDEFRTKVKEIIVEVFDTITIDSNPVSEWREYKLKSCLEESDTDMYNVKSNENVSNEQNFIRSDIPIQCIQVSDMEINCSKNSEQVTRKRKSSDLESASKAAVPELIDDGIHPLLQSKLVIEEDEKILVEKAEKILERNLSPHQSFDTSSELDCSEVPCTPWCNHVPSPVKKAYDEYHRQQAENAKKHNELRRQQQSAVRWPAFTRSLSADEAPLYSSLSETFDSRDMLLLRAKYPLLYLKVQSSNKRKYESCDLTEQRLHDSSHTGSTMWGKFAGADSLWKPLPECMPANIFNHQQNLYKRGRDSSRSTKRQRTMS